LVIKKLKGLAGFIEGSKQLGWLPILPIGKPGYWLPGVLIFGTTHYLSGVLIRVEPRGSLGLRLG